MSEHAPPTPNGDYSDFGPPEVLQVFTLSDGVEVREVRLRTYELLDLPRARAAFDAQGFVIPPEITQERWVEALRMVLPLRTTVEGPEPEECGA